MEMTPQASMLELTPDPEVQSDTDLELVEALRRGKAGAAERLVTRYGDRAYRLAIRLCGRKEDAEEAVQDAFWAVIRKVDTFRGEATLWSWLYRIVANAAFQKLRDRRGRETCLEEVLPRFDEQGRHVGPVDDWSARLTDPSADTELRMALTSAIEQLPPDGRALLLLRDAEGFSNREVAAILNLSVAAVKARVHRARLLVRKQLGDAVVGSESWHCDGSGRAEAGGE
jgi:RNA polymerase sigma-70 factor, ECF subfamily